MKVILTNFIPLPEETIIEAAATCWRSTPREEILDHILKAGHFTPLEFAVFNFRIEGVSRALTHQLVRKRVGVAFCQESQRYVSYEECFDYVTPPSADNQIFHEFMDFVHLKYKELVEYGIPKQDARFILPNACTSTIAMSINYHALLDLAKERLCGRAQWEIQELVKRLKAEVSKVAPRLGKYLQPKCFWLKHCPEGKPCENYAGKVCKCDPIITEDDGYAD